uniref:NADH dehydrogenase subunit 4L n=1 Tax=Galba pervia TaxID=1051332 RepID=J3R5X8_9GAST|nr:NADH dehydrogenase subunit 4L [Galba pervia]AEO51214.1 NADH dehydrogenase subunit 4L [Galba pervia]
MLQLSFLFVLFFCLTFYRNFYYILNLLIILEAMMLTLIMFNFCSNLIFFSTSYMMLILLTLAASEAALGLSLLVSFLRVRGNNYLLNMTSTNWFAKNSYCWKYNCFTNPYKNFYLMKWWFNFSVTISYTNFNSFFSINTLYISYYKYFCIRNSY